MAFLKHGWTFPGLSWPFTVGVKKYSFWCPPKWSSSFLILFLKNELFELTEGYPWRPVTRNYIKKNYFALTTNGNRWCSSKRWWFFPLRLIFYVCSFARNWVSYMYKGIYEIPLGSNNPVCLKFLHWNIKKKMVPWNDQSLFVLYLKDEFSSRTMKNTYFALTTNGNRWRSSKRWWISSIYVVLQGIESLTCIRVYM